MHTTEHTEPLIGLAKLMRMAYSGCDLAPLGTQLIERAETDTGGHALMAGRRDGDVSRPSIQERQQQHDDEQEETQDSHVWNDSMRQANAKD